MIPAARPHCFLGVEVSATGRFWAGPDAAQMRLAEALAQATALPLPLCTVLARRGVSPEDALGFLQPRLRDLLPDPRGLRDMQAAASRLNAAVTRGEAIAVFADYDVDGACSAALLHDWLHAQGIRATIYVPDRIDEGYGPNVPAMERLARSHDLIICVDCGTLSHKALAAADGADVLVLDHHLGGETLPPALAVVNPNRQDEDRSLSHLCAAGVVFLVLVEANRQGREAGRQGPDLMQMLDLVALATVADVAPLIGVNRALVRQGLSVMARRARPGLAALTDSAGLGVAPSAHHLGFVLGPRINAGGRVGSADLGVRLLVTGDRDEAAALAARLEALNAERREIETDVREAALAQAECRGLEGPLVWAAEDGWHPGVLGIVAARLKEATGRPSVVIGFEGDTGKGSARSVPGIDIGAAVQRLAAEGLLEKGGGHPMAAGLTVARSHLGAAMDRLAELLARQGAGGHRAETLALDGMLAPTGATRDLVEAIERAGPFGAAAAAPRFAFPAVLIKRLRPVGNGHLALSFGDAAATVEAVAFNIADKPLGVFLRDRQGHAVHLAGQIGRAHV